MRLKCLAECVNQETGKRHKAGDVIEVGQAEGGRLMAFRLAVPAAEVPVVETQMMAQPETRREKVKPGRKPKEDRFRYSGLSEFRH